jgi:LysR family hydrogen peroxide-inducible transcriptional activator
MTMSFPPLPSVTLRQLQYVIAVADRGGFRLAADACGVAQPSLSAQVALAERQLGVQIFERGQRQVRLSAAGGRIVEQARRVLVATADLADTARRLADPFKGTLRLGVIPTVGPYLLPEITPALANAYPDLQLLWTEGRTHELVQRLKDGTVDGLVLALEPALRDLDHVVLGQDAFVLAGRSTHPLVNTNGRAATSSLNSAHVLLLDDGHCLRDQALKVCKRSGALESSFRATSLGTLVQMVSASDSVTLLPSLAVAVENRRGQLKIRRFTAPEPGRTLIMAWRRGAPVSTPLKALAETIRATMTHARRTETTTDTAEHGRKETAARRTERARRSSARGTTLVQ